MDYENWGLSVDDEVKSELWIKIQKHEKNPL